MNAPRSDLDVVGKVADSFLARYRRGERPSVSEYTARYPELAGVGDRHVVGVGDIEIDVRHQSPAVRRDGALGGIGIFD